jgi:hypothetical protein
MSRANRKPVPGAVADNAVPKQLEPQADQTWLDGKDDISGSEALELTQEYETNARDMARLQAVLAAERLARTLNEAFH